ncbi:MAG TPA: hypothetical protein VLL52_06125, partial [Anaerolineae bacterium]|nr:hypothetical protein [Anaerolineae bacterium]
LRLPDVAGLAWVPAGTRVEIFYGECPLEGCAADVWWAVGGRWWGAVANGGVEMDGLFWLGVGDNVVVMTGEGVVVGGAAPAEPERLLGWGLWR